MLFKNINSIFKNTLQWIGALKFYNTNLNDVLTVNLTPVNKKKPLQLITVTFNNDSLLSHQIKLINKNLLDDFFFIVADNSDNKQKKKSIRKICEEHGIGYIALPRNPYFSGSGSHGGSLNWMYKKYLSHVKPDFFGFIDHDAYPVQQHSLIKILNKQPIYGTIQIREKFWYIWAGLCFYRFDITQNQKINFLPGTIDGVNLDTGGLNWEGIYKRLNKNELDFPEHYYISLRDGDVLQSDKMERIGSWLHTFNGSNWMGVEARDEEINNYLSALYK